jgi:hypothetical protein
MHISSLVGSTMLSVPQNKLNVEKNCPDIFSGIILVLSWKK